MRWAWLRSRWAAVVAGLIVGAVVGVAVYQGSTLSGRALFVLCGTTAGAVAAIVIHAYWRTVRLTEVTLSIPQFTNLTFAITKNNEQVAWRLFVEAVTRISVQRLDEDSGLIREALSSLYTLFATTREVLTQTHPSRRTGANPTVEHVAIGMLNNELRPFMSKWHPRLRAWEQANPGRAESDWPDGGACRTELEATRQQLLRYVRGFGELAMVPNVEDLMQGSFAPGFADAPAPIRQQTRTT